MSEYAVTITCKIDDTIKTIVLDTVNATSISATSDLTTHPMANGDIVADHIIKQPITMSISGTFSIKGGKAIVVSSEGSILADVEKLFEQIKNEGIQCDIVKVHQCANDTATFSHRQNMVLTNISWTENINTLDFSFSFTEALLADVITYDVDITDELLPNITEPETLNFTDTLFDVTQFDIAVMDVLKSSDLITQRFINDLQSLSASALVALGVAAGVAAIVASIPGVGWAAIAVSAAVAGALVVIHGFAKLIRRGIEADKYKVKQFRHYLIDKKNKKEIQRFCNFEGEIHKQAEQLNNSIQVYRLSANQQQECMLSISNNYYIFTFTKNNTTGDYSLVVKNVNDTIKASMTNITSTIVDISECTEQNYLFRADESGEYVYLIRSEEEDKEKTDLTTYYILISNINMAEYSKVLNDIIVNALTY